MVYCMKHYLLQVRHLSVCGPYSTDDVWADSSVALMSVSAHMCVTVA